MSKTKRSKGQKGPKNMKKQKYREAVIELLRSKTNQIYKNRDLALQLKVPNHDYQDFKHIVRSMAEEGVILRHKGNRYGWPKKREIVTGVLDVKPAGFGFLRQDDGGEDVFIGRRQLESAVHQDRVRVAVLQSEKGRLPEGRVVEVLERSFSRLVGTFQESPEMNYIIPDELKLGNVVIKDQDRGGARPGQKVVVEVIHWASMRRFTQGRVVEVLGFPDEKGVDVLSIACGAGLPLAFPEEVEAEANRLPDEVTVDLSADRRDLRDLFTVTVDPDDAKDFDDAISLESLKNGRWRLGVHIADVSAFVPVNSAIDREALRRGTSVYLVDRVIPMLPDKLSSDLCSLRPGQDRLTFSVMMTLSSDASVESYELYEGVIRSRHRLTYREAQTHIDEARMATTQSSRKASRDARGSAEQGEPELQTMFLAMAELARKLKDRWSRTGSIDFTVPESRIDLDEAGRPVSLGVREPLETHGIIEAFMLLANRTVAEHVQNVRAGTGEPLSFIYRNHEKPGGDKLTEFTRFVRSLGYTFDPGKHVTPKQFQDLLGRIKGTRFEILIGDVALRTMMKAVYSSKNIGHFGLAFKQYTHFTSPIRRYPDLIAHRLLKQFASNPGEKLKLAEKLSQICDIATEREIKAQKAERESIRVKQVEYMQDHLNEEFDAIVSGIVPFGFFVEITDLLVEGLVPLRTIADESFIVDEKNYRLIGERRGLQFRLGDSVRVKVASVLLQTRQIDFELIEGESVSSSV